MSGPFRRPAFRRLWLGHSVSALGSAVTSVALPLAAVVELDASALEMGILTALPSVARIAFSLQLGAWIDRSRRRPVMVATQLARALLLASVPAVALLDLLSIEYLYGVALLSGALRLAFQFADRAWLPSLVPRDEILEANARLQLSGSAAGFAGPAIGGRLVELLTAPLAIGLDALSYLVSALLLMRIPEPKPRAETAGPRRKMSDELRDARALVARSVVLRSTILSSLLATAGASMIGAVMMLFLSRQLGLSATAIGIVFSLSGGASVLASLLAPVLARRIDPPRAVLWATLVPAVGYAAIALAGVAPVPSLVMLAVGQALVGLGAPIYTINEVTLRQSVTPAGALGRISSFRTFFAGGIAPFGALAGGVLGEIIGLRGALAVGAAVFAAALLALGPLVRGGSHELGGEP